MPYSFTEKKRIRKSFAKRAERAVGALPARDPARVVHAVPAGGHARRKRKNEGLQAAFSSIFPISSHNGMARLEFVSFNLGEPAFDVKECQQRGLTYASPLRAKVRLVIMDREATKPTVKEVKEQEVYMGEMPLMTTTGSFVINGTERVIVSQLHRSPGVFFEHDRGKTHSSGKLLFSARVIPYRGSWLDFEFDPKDILYFRVDRRRKMPATILLKAIGLSNEQVLAHFFRFDTFQLGAEGGFMELVPERLRGEIARFDIVDKAGKVVVAKDKRINAKHIRDMEAAGMKRIAVTEDYLLGRVLANNVIDPETGEIVAAANDELTEETLKKLRTANVQEIRTIYTNDLDQGPFISQHAAHRRDRRPAGGAHRDLPDDASGRTADRGRSRDAVPAAVLRRRDLRPVSRRPHEGQFALRPPRNHRADDARQRGHHRHDETPGRAAQRSRRDRRHRPPGQPPRALRRRAGGEPVPRRPCARRTSGQGTPRPGGNRKPDAARSDQQQADQRIDPRVLRVVATVAVHGPDQPAVGDHAQASCLRTRTGRPDARARRLRGARRASDALRPRLPDRDARKARTSA